MNLPCSGPPSGLRRQRGAVAIMFGLTLIVLLAAGGLVIDLGHLYVLKSELQNAADSGALAGAKEIDLTTDGVTRAAAKAIAFAGQNNFNFATPLTLTNTNVKFSSRPDGPWFSVGESEANPAGKTFIKVDTGPKSVPTYLMRVTGRNNITTGGVAVAGRFVIDVTPMGVCAIASERYGARLTSDGQQELLEYGYRRGISLDILAMSAIGGSADPMLINPVDTPPTACDMNHSSANFTAPFICQGNSALSSNATDAYANTGVSTSVQKAINSRFDNFQGSPCSSTTSPPDSNIKQYTWDAAPGTGGPSDWMAQPPTSQSYPINPITGRPADPSTLGADGFGVLWTYSRPLRAVGSAGAYSPGSEFSVSDWPVLYHPDTIANTGAGGYPAGAGNSPYLQASGSAYQSTPSHPSAAKRRVINLVIVDCSVATGNGMSCKRLAILGIGRFFLQKEASLSSNPGLNVEFAGLIAPVPNSEIKLYRDTP